MTWREQRIAESNLLLTLAFEVLEEPTEPGIDVETFKKKLAERYKRRAYERSNERDYN